MVSLEPGRENFVTWRETSTVYHEGVPGHHLQIATTVYQADSLNRYQRLLAGTQRPRRRLGPVRGTPDARSWVTWQDDGDLMGSWTPTCSAARACDHPTIGMHLELTSPRAPASTRASGGRRYWA